MIEKGGFDARTHIANRFRTEFKTGTPKGDEYHKLNSREASKAFRLKWLSKEHNEIQAQLRETNCQNST